MGLVEPEAEPRRTSSRSWLAGIGEHLSVQNLALGVAALLVIGLFSWNMLLQGEVRDLRGRVQNLQASQEESRMVALEGPGAAHGAHVEVMILGDQRAVLMAEDMPPVPKDRTFQIWIIDDDVPKPSGLFETREDPVATVIDQPLNGADAVAVSVEPEGGSPKPTTAPMLTAKL